MKFANKSGSILSLGRAELRPYAISRNFTEKEMDSIPSIAFYISKGVIVEYKDGDSMPKPLVKRKSAVKYEMDSQEASGETVTKMVNDHKVQYVVANAEGVDNVEMSDASAVTSADGKVHTTADYIEQGVDASQFKNGALAIERALNKESAEAEYNDDDTLAENESERAEVLDLDKIEEADMGRIVKKDGKFGAHETTAKAMVEADISSGMNKVTKEFAKGLDDREAVPADQAPAKVVEFLKQSFHAKKFMISKEGDKEFLAEIGGVTQSDAIKQLVTQRMSELK